MLLGNRTQLPVVSLRCSLCNQTGRAVTRADMENGSLISELFTSSSLLGMWRMQHRMDLAFILKALSPSLRPSLTRWTTSSGLRSPLRKERKRKNSLKHGESEQTGSGPPALDLHVPGVNWNSSDCVCAGNTPTGVLLEPLSRII